MRRDANALTLDLFQIFIAPLETELGAKSSHAAGRSHGIANSHEYFARMEAINFTQTHDDGAATRDLGKAQVILVGVSRCGKTPTSLYLALQFGIRAANFPLTPDDFADRKLPASVLPLRDRLFGLTINPERLHKIREERRPGSKYAALENCRYEVRECEHLLEREGIPMLDTTAKSIEEIATTIMLSREAAAARLLTRDPTQDRRDRSGPRRRHHPRSSALSEYDGEAEARLAKPDAE